MDDARLHRGWHSRGYLPHLDAPKEVQALTFRLADSVPGDVLKRWQAELAHEASTGNAERLLRSGGLACDEDSALSSRSRILHQRIARYEDAGHGSCVLGDPRCAALLQDELLLRDGERYRLLEWCIMPNHVHVLLQCVPGFSLGSIVRGWKTFTARGINVCLNQSGKLWAEDYHDRYIRDADHLANARAYIRRNPVKAGLCKTPEEWLWSSAGWRDSAR